MDGYDSKPVTLEHPSKSAKKPTGPEQDETQSDVGGAVLFAGFIVGVITVLAAFGIVFLSRLKLG